MATKIYKHFTIQCSSDSAYDQNSAENIQDYQKIYFEESDYILPSIFGIKVFANGNLSSSAIIGVAGGATTIHETSFEISQNRMYICCGSNCSFSRYRKMFSPRKFYLSGENSAPIPATSHSARPLVKNSQINTKYEL